MKVIPIKKHPAALFWDPEFHDKIPDAVRNNRPKLEEDLAHLVDGAKRLVKSYTERGRELIEEAIAELFTTKQN